MSRRYQVAMKLVATVAIVSLLMPPAASAQSLKVESDKGTNFSQFHTYTFAPAPYAIRNLDALLAMGLAVGEELEAKGLRFVASQQKTYQIFIAYNAQIIPDPQDSSRKSVVITVDMIDARNNNIVWRAGGNVSLGSDNAENRRNVRRMLAAMFQKYPPK